MAYSEAQYSELHDMLANQTNPWKHPELYGQPGRVKADWRRRVKRWKLNLDSVAGRFDKSW